MITRALFTKASILWGPSESRGARFICSICKGWYKSRDLGTRVISIPVRLQKKKEKKFTHTQQTRGWSSGEGWWVGSPIIYRYLNRKSKFEEAQHLEYCEIHSKDTRLIISLNVMLLNNANQGQKLSNVSNKVLSKCRWISVYLLIPKKWSNLFMYKAEFMTQKVNNTNVS